MEKKQKKIIKNTVSFWKHHGGIELSRHEANEAVFNICGYFQVLMGWQERDSKNRKAINEKKDVLNESDSDSDII
jgi:hypothetical protein